MKELSLNILDIAENSVKAQATLTEIIIDETGNTVTITIRDNGHGMTPEFLQTVTDPFSTTRTTRKVGLGLAFLKLEAEQTGGGIAIESKHVDLYPETHGTVVKAVFYKDSIDCPPLGDVTASIVTLIQGHPDTDFVFEHNISGRQINLDTRQLREVLEDVPLNSYEVIKWIEEYLREQYL